MFKVGEQVAHYKEGVCEITKIGKLDITCSDRQKEYYTLRPLYNKGGTLYVPVGSEEKQLRRIVTNEEANRLIEEMPGIEALNISDERRREIIYKDALFRNQCRAWVALIKTSYLRNQERISKGKKVINVDDRYFNSAERFLSGELAVALGISREKVREYISEKISGAEIS